MKPRAVTPSRGSRYVQNFAVSQIPTWSNCLDLLATLGPFRAEKIFGRHTRSGCSTSSGFITTTASWSASGKDGKRLPRRTLAMKPGPARDPIRMEDILYFEAARDVG